MTPEALMRELDRAYQGLQHLNIEPNKANLAILMDALQTMENAYHFIGGLKNEAENTQKEEEQAGEADA